MYKYFGIQLKSRSKNSSKFVQAIDECPWLRFITKMSTTSLVQLKLIVNGGVKCPIGGIVKLKTIRLGTSSNGYHEDTLWFKFV